MALIPLETFLRTQAQAQPSGATATGPGVPPPRPPAPLRPASAGADQQTLATLGAVSSASRLLGQGVNMFRLSPTVGGSLGAAGALAGGAARALNSKNDLQRGLNVASGVVGAGASAGTIPAVAAAFPSLANFSRIPGIPYAGPVIGFGADLAGGQDPSKAAAKLAINAALTYAGAGFAAPLFAPAIDNLMTQIFGGKDIHDFNREMRVKEEENISGSVRETLKGATPDTITDILASTTAAGVKGSPALIGNALGLFVGSNSPGGTLYGNHPERPFNETLAALSVAMPELGYTTTDYSKEPTGKFTGGIGYTSGTAYDEWVGFADQVAAQLRQSHPDVWARAMARVPELRQQGEAERAAQEATRLQTEREQELRWNREGGA